MKDRIGNQREESEWEPVKILYKNLVYAPNRFNVSLF
jgi:hypothetical protein